MTDQVFFASVGDLLQTLEVRLTLDGSTVDLSNASTATLVWLKEGSAAYGHASMTFSDRPGGKVKRTWDGTETILQSDGEWRFWIVLGWPSSKPQTVPNDGSSFIARISPQRPTT